MRRLFRRIKHRRNPSVGVGNPTYSTTISNTPGQYNSCTWDDDGGSNAFNISCGEESYCAAGVPCWFTQWDAIYFDANSQAAMAEIQYDSQAYPVPGTYSVAYTDDAGESRTLTVIIG
jgi:hypothetical protein